MGAETSVSRYDPILRLAAGGMGTVWVAAARGALGFRQLVALKKPHEHLLAHASFITELVAEARLASMIRHVNVVAARDVEVAGESITIVMDYIEGASLHELLSAAVKRGERIAPRAAVRIVLDALAGLHAAHELVDEKGRSVNLVHRDVSPQNILVGTDGIARVADFGIAKFVRKNIESSGGHIKGKLSYMAPEHAHGREIDRRADIFGVGVVLWEALTGDRLFLGDNDVETIQRLVSNEAATLAELVPDLAVLDPVLLHSLAKTPDERFGNALAMATALETAAADAKLVGTHAEVAAMVKELAGEALEVRKGVIRDRLAAEPTVSSMLDVTPESLRVAKNPGSSPSLPPKVPDSSPALPPQVPAASPSSPSLEAASAPSTPASAAAPPLATPSRHAAPPTSSRRRAYLTVLAAAFAGLLVAVVLTLIVARQRRAEATVTPSAPPIGSAPASASAAAPVAPVASSAAQTPSAEPAEPPSAASAAPSGSTAPRRVWRPTKKPPPSNPWNVNLK